MMVLALGVSALALVVSCAQDTDPRYGNSGAIDEFDVPIGASSGAAPPPVEGGASGDPLTIFNTEVYPAPGNVKGTCEGCHIQGGVPQGPVFFGATAQETYDLLKQQGYHMPNTRFVTYGRHTGPALTPAQKPLVEKWQAAEAAKGGGSAPVDAGAD
ncbi:MAG: hypothetical protein KF819_17410 [Labilithrix sp.]|nr:hypothetical protein [Labilithrix sp.]